MSQHVSIACPNCSRILLIPHQILGRGGRCRHCGHLFRAQVQGDPDQELSLSTYYCPPFEAGAPGDSDLMLSSSTITVLAPGDEDGHHDAPRPWPFHGLASACRRLAARIGEQAGKLPQFDPRPWLVLLRSRAQQPWGQDNPAPAPGQRTLELKQEWEASRGKIDELRSELSAIREQAAQANRLKEAFRADLAEIETIRIQLKEAYPLAIDPNSQAALEKIQELEALRAECRRLHEEVRVLRSQLESQATEAREKCNHLTEERDSACAERDRWRAERAAIERELEQARDLFGAERDAIGREVDQFQTQLGELERSLEEAGREHERERASRENERTELEEELERRRRALLEAEARLSEQQAGFEAERQSWRRQLDEHARQTAEREARLGEVEQLWERTGRERDALERRVELLQGDLATSERLRAAVESELNQARAAWKARRQELQVHWEQQRRDLLAETELRIEEQQAEFEAERRSWNQRVEEHAQMAAVWESLAQEVEQVQAGLIEDRELLTRELRQLRDQLSESEKSRAEAEEQHNEACGRWEAERRELEARREQQRQGDLADAERRLDELRDQLEAERRARRQQADQHARMAAEREAQLGELERFRERTDRERDALTRTVERLREQLRELERAPVATGSDLDQARAAWEAERRELEARWEQQRQGDLADAERRLDELRDQLEAERRARRQQADTGCALESLREEAARLHGALETTRREREEGLRQVAATGLERDRLSTRLEEAEADRHESERKHLAERDRLVAALEQAREASEAAARLRAEQAEAVRVLRTKLECQRKDRGALEVEARRNLVALRREWDDERRCWLEWLGADRPAALRDNPHTIPAHATSPPGDSSPLSTAAMRSQDATAGGDAGSVAPVFSPSKRMDRPLRRPGVPTAFRPRPQACSYDDPEAFRTHLEQWLAEARASLQGMSANTNRPANPALSRWLEYEIKTAREEIALLVQELAPDAGDPAEEQAVSLQTA
jgi:chromosome segregation ATPase